jgi:HK97 gp10 family phage protein
VAKEVTRAAIQVDRRAKALCPVDTGRLRASINWRLGSDARGVLGIIGTNVSYAVFQEFGTRHQAAQPFLRPALASIGGR